MHTKSTCIISYNTVCRTGRRRWMSSNLSEGERESGLRLLTSAQRTVHLAEKLCSFYLLKVVGEFAHSHYCMVEVLRRDFAPFTSSTHKALHGERAGKVDGGGLTGGCVIRSAGTQTQPVLNEEYKTSAWLLPLESSVYQVVCPPPPCISRRVLGSKYFCASGPAVQGRSSCAPSPAQFLLSMPVVCRRGSSDSHC